MKKVISLILFYVFISHPMLGQKLQPHEELRDSSIVQALNAALLSNVEIPSYKENMLPPEMRLMNMYGDYPVNLSNGLVDISIPLYEIKTPHLSLPITAKFHASGLRADEEEGLLGLRWLLDVTYSVNRVVKGYPDDEYYSSGNIPFDNRVSDPSYFPDLSTLYGITGEPSDAGKIAIPNRMIHKLIEYTGPESKYMDTEYDIFSYHLPSGKSGKFILRDSAGIKIPQTLPYEPVKIEINNMNPAKNRFEQFTITDENGIVYNYGKTIHLPVPHLDIESNNWGSDNEYTSTWKLNAIISANKTDSILFNYDHSLFLATKIKGYYTWSKIKYTNVSELLIGSDVAGAARSFYEDELEHESLAAGGRAKSQYFDTTKPNKYSNNLSKITFKGGEILFNYEAIFNKHYLSSMDVYDTNSSKVNRIVFSYRKDAPSSFVLLSELSAMNPQNAKKETYKFSYYNTQLYADDSDEIPSDWWGYYTKSGCNVLWEDSIRVEIDRLTSYHSGTKLITVGYDRDRNKDKSSSLANMKIGMIESIEYPTGGKTIYDYETNYYTRTGNEFPLPCGGLRIKTVRNISADGKSEWKTYGYGSGYMPEYFYPVKPFGKSRYRNYVNQQIVYARWLSAWDPIGDSVHSFDHFIDYIKTEYSNLIPGQFMDFHSNIVYYNRVVEYQGTTDSNTGYTEFHYSYRLPSYTEYPRLVINEYETNGWRQNIHVLPSKFGENSRLIRKITLDKDGNKMKEAIYDYTDFSKGLLYDMPIRQDIKFKLGGPGLGNKDDVKDFRLMMSDFFVDDAFSHINQEYQLGASRLTKETIHTYTPEGTVTVVKNTAYDPLHLLPVKETMTSSIDNKTVSSTYKYPYQYSTEPYTGMAKKNMLNLVIEKGNYMNESLLEKGITNYKQWAADVYAPTNFQYQKVGYSAETRLEYQYNNRGQLDATIKDGTQKAVYIRNAYAMPLAVIDQANYSEVETVLGATFINQLSQKHTPTDTDWATLNGLRTRLPNAHVTTYKYKLLIGISEMTNPSGLTTYYDYDNQGRLKEIYIRNAGVKEVLESYEYNYANQ